MKTHVLLLQESIFIPNTWHTQEFNKGEAADNHVHYYSGLDKNSDEQEPQDMTLEEMVPYLVRDLGFTPLDFDKAHPQLGAFSLVEIFLSCTAIIYIFQYKVNGLPLRSCRYELSDVMDKLE